MELLEVPYTLFYEHDDVLLSSKRVRQVRKEQEQLNSLSLSRPFRSLFEKPTYVGINTWLPQKKLSKTKPFHDCLGLSDKIYYILSQLSSTRPEKSGAKPKTEPFRQSSLDRTLVKTDISLRRYIYSYSSISISI